MDRRHSLTPHEEVNSQITAERAGCLQKNKQQGGVKGSLKGLDEDWTERLLTRGAKPELPLWRTRLPESEVLDVHGEASPSHFRNQITRETTLFCQASTAEGG